MAQDEDWEDSSTITQVMPPTVSETRMQPALRDTKALLIVLVGNDAGRTHVVQQKVIIGRTVDADVRVIAEDVSRQHAIVRQMRPGEFYIEDLGSVNGTWYKGEKIEKMKIKEGDEIFICDEKFKFVLR